MHVVRILTYYKLMLFPGIKSIYVECTLEMKNITSEKQSNFHEAEFIDRNCMPWRLSNRNSITAKELNDIGFSCTSKWFPNSFQEEKVIYRNRKKDTGMQGVFHHFLLIEFI